MIRRIVLVVALLAAGLSVSPSPARAAAPSISGLTAPATVGRYAKFESTASISPLPANPYDPANIDVEGRFVSPSGVRYSIPGFPYQGYSRTLSSGGSEVLTPAGALVWKVRFALPETGMWTWSWDVITPGGTTSSPASTVTVTSSSSHGFLQTSPTDNRYLSYSDGAPFFAVGQNFDFPDGSTQARQRTYAYDTWFGELAAQGANYSRVWMAPFGDATADGFGVEWKDTGLGNYGARQDNAWDLDYIVDLAGQKGIELQLTLLWHAAFSTTVDPDWANNPYNAANGGPLTSPGGVFTEPNTQMLLKRLFRYVVARWGYATSIAAWELWNEVGYVDGYDRSASQQWHSAMASYLRQQDPAHRPVTSSLGSIGNNAQDPQLFANAGLDLSQVHHYASGSCSGCNWPLQLRSRIVSARGLAPVPVLIGEEAISHTDGTTFYNNDQKAIGYHDALWSPLLSGAYGTGLSWFWSATENHASTYYPQLGAISRFVAPVRLDQDSLISDVTTQTPPAHTVDVYGLHGTHTALYWLKDRAHQWGSQAAIPTANASVTLPTSATGHWCGTWYDTWNGTSTTAVSSTTSGTTLTAPLFQGDTALRLTAC